MKEYGRSYAVGIPCNWIGVGVVIFLDFRNCSIDSGIFMSYETVNPALMESSII